jgi:hypothetical protein
MNRLAILNWLCSVPDNFSLILGLLEDFAACAARARRLRGTPSADSLAAIQAEPLSDAELTAAKDAQGMAAALAIDPNRVAAILPYMVQLGAVVALVTGQPAPDVADESEADTEIAAEPPKPSE